MQVNLDIKEVIMLEVAESIEMKADEYCHDFRPAHSTFPIAVIQKISVILSLVISITIVSFYFITN